MAPRWTRVTWVLAGASLVVAISLFLLRRAPNEPAGTAVASPTPDDFGIEAARKTSSLSRIDPRLLIGKTDSNEPPWKLISRYAKGELADRVATLGYLSSESAWSDRERAWLLDLVLRDPVEEIRMAGLLQVEQHYFDAALPLLERTLRDPSADVRAMAVDALAASDDEEAIPMLEQALLDTQDFVRMRVLDSIASLDEDRQRPILLQALSSTDDTLAVTALQAMWAVASPDVLPPVIQLLESPSALRREAAQEFLSTLLGTDVRDEFSITDWLAENQERLPELFPQPPPQRPLPATPADLPEGENPRFPLAQ